MFSFHCMTVIMLPFQGRQKCFCISITMEIFLNFLNRFLITQKWFIKSVFVKFSKQFIVCTRVTRRLYFFGTLYFLAWMSLVYEKSGCRKKKSVLMFIPILFSRTKTIQKNGLSWNVKKWNMRKEEPISSLTMNQSS